MAAPPPLNRPACARLEYTHPACGRVRRAFVRHCSKKLGAHRRRKATDGQSPARVISASSSGKEAPPKGRQPRTAKARPPLKGGRVGLLRPHLIGNPHEDRIRSPDREDLQVVSKVGYVGKAGNHGSPPSGLSGRRAALNAVRLPIFQVCSCGHPQAAMPNPSLNLRANGMPSGPPAGVVTFPSVGPVVIPSSPG